jgi:hypothetical protein
MVEPKGAIHSEISQVLDDEFIQHQIQHGVLDLNKVLHYVGGKMAALCAPVRDPQIQQLKTMAMVDAMMSISDLLQDMKLDLLNFRLQALRPHLITQAIAYERSRFELALEKGLSLDRTRAWLTPMAKEYTKKEEIVDHAFIKLFFEPMDLPETLQLDARRIFDLQNEIQAVCIVASLTTLARTIVPVLKKDDQGCRELVDRLFVVLQDEHTKLDTLKETIMECVQTSLDRQTRTFVHLSQFTSNPAPKPLHADQTQLISQMVEKTVSLKDPFFGILVRRVEKCVRLGVLGTRADCGSLGLSMVEPQVMAIVDRVKRLVSHNKNVHARVYNSILATL